MKEIHKILGLLPMVAFLVMTACSSNDSNIEKAEFDQSVKIIPYMVTVNGESSTRATVDGDLKKLYFAAGDKLYISGTNISGVMDIQTGAGTASATFSGSLTYTGGGTPASDLTLNATLVSDQQTDGVEVTIAANKTVTVNYGTALCADVNTAVQKYSLLTGTSTYGSKSFSLTQQTAFLNFAITLNDGTSSGDNVTVTVANVGGSDRTGSIKAITEDGKVKAKFVAPVATQTLSGSSFTIGTIPPINFGESIVLGAKVYNIVRTLHDLKLAVANVPASESWYIFQSDNTNSTGNGINVGAGGNITINGLNMEEASIVCSGDASIIIVDGSTNTIYNNTTKGKCGVQIGPENTETIIKGESAGTGILTVRGSENAAGIGAKCGGTFGNITIQSGVITASSGGWSAGIGGANNDDGNSKGHCGNILISGGTIVATGGYDGAGIGSGYYNVSCGNITISGGTVTAISNNGSAGIGAGFDNSTYGNITISGGEVTATGPGSGIGGSSESQAGGKITISGGTVIAECTGLGAGIGSGEKGKCGDIEISGGSVQSIGGNYSAGIGCGFSSSYKQSHCGSITITSAVTKVIAVCGVKGVPSPIGKASDSYTYDPQPYGIVGTITIDGIESPSSSSVFPNLTLAVKTTRKENDTWEFSR